jgi:sorbitol-specific phosphotransferase system component IIC
VVKLIVLLLVVLVIRNIVLEKKVERLSDMQAKASLKTSSIDYAGILTNRRPQTRISGMKYKYE